MSVQYPSSGGGGGSGTVTSVGLALPTDIFLITNSPVTVTGTLTGSMKVQLKNLVYASPDGATGAPSFRALVAGDLPASGSSANLALSNLASVSINTSLLAQTGVDLGAAGTPFRNLFLSGAGTFGSASVELTGTPTGNRVLTLPDITATLTTTIASGTSALGTSAIGSGAKATTVTTTATGTLTTDTIMADFNADPTAVTGYSPTANGMLTIIKFPTANAVNFIVVNNTNASITPGAITLNWKVVR